MHFIPRWSFSFQKVVRGRTVRDNWQNSFVSRCCFKKISYYFSCEKLLINQDSFPFEKEKIWILKRNMWDKTLNKSRTMGLALLILFFSNFPVNALKICLMLIDLIQNDVPCVGFTLLIKTQCFGNWRKTKNPSYPHKISVFFLKRQTARNLFYRNR